MVTKAEWAKAYDMAKSDVDLSQFEIDLFYGYGLPDFKPVIVPIQCFARLIRWQCQYLNGNWDCEALNELHKVSRGRITILS